MKCLTFHDKFVIRTPLYPVNKITDFDLQWKAMDKKLEDSLFLASPDLLKEINRLNSEETNHSNANHNKIKRSCYKYWTRAHMRCTPYGLFAGCHIGEWGNDTNLTVPIANSIIRHTNLDMNFLCILGKHLESHPDIKGQVKLYPNTSIYRSNNKIRYIYYTYDERNNRQHQLNAVEVDEYVNRILAKAKPGAQIRELAEILVDEEITKDDALDFVDQFVQAQLLVSELEVAIAGPNYLDQILSTLKKLNTQTVYINNTVQILIIIKEHLKSLDKELFNRKERYFEVVKIIEQLGLPYDLSKLFQTDTYKKTTKLPTLNKHLKKEILYTIDFLDQLFPNQKESELTKFAQKFQERYENRRVNLLDALDIETGISFPVNNNLPIDNPIVNGVYGGKNQQRVGKIDWSQHENFLVNLIERSHKNNEFEIDLKPLREKLKFNQNKKPLAYTISLLGNILGTDENENLQFRLDHAGGSNSNTLLGRFAHGSKDIADIINDSLKFEKEANKEVILAEIIHLPEARTGNVLKHPQFYEHEVCYLAKPGVPIENNIDLTDLELFVQNDKITLWSKKHNKEVIPRLSNAHNFLISSLPVYKFLCALQYHKIKSGVTFTWGSLENIFNFFPRIRFGNIIVSEAKWRFRQEKLEPLIKKYKSSAPTRFEDFKDFCNTHNLPERFLLTQNDNKILIDSNNEISVEMFLDTVKSHKVINISEFLFDNYKSVSIDEAGNHYTNEIIAILHNTNTQNNIATNTPPSHNIQNIFPPGSEWIYFKIYCGNKTSDLILTEYIKPFIDSIKEQAFFDKWFFIRYFDTDNHIRFRIKIKQIESLGMVQQAFYSILKKLIDKGTVHNIMLDTYKREVSRYGYHTMSLSEDYFYADSENITHFISRIEGEDGEEYRWKYVLASIDSLLSSFEYDLDKKGKLLSYLAHGFGTEFGFDKTMKISLDKKFRGHKDTISSIIKKELINEDYKEFFEIIALREKQISQTAKSIIKICNTQSEKPSLDDLMSSYIHMLCNRVFISNQRFHEFVIYYLLSKYYAGEIGRMKYNIST